MPTERVVFYSWQSDRPNKIGRSFIQTALEVSGEALKADASLAVEPRIDSDAAGAPGAADIADTIFAKIDSAAVFVADVTFVTDTGGRLSPNPNVLIELGYAIKALGWPRVLLVLNEFYGRVEHLPFDLRGRRAFRYNVAPDESDATRRAARGALAVGLTEGIAVSLRTMALVVIETPVVAAIGAIEVVRPNRAALVRRAAADLHARLAAIAPDLHVADRAVDAFVQTLDQTWPIIADFVRLSRHVSEHRDGEALSALFEVIRLAAAGLTEPRSGATYQHGYDYWRFLTIELHLILIASLLREGQLELAGEVARYPVVVNEAGRSYNLTLNDRGHVVHRLGEWAKSAASPTGQFLRDRYKAGTALAELISFDELVDADLFLLLAGGPSVGPVIAESNWSPWLLPYASHLPRFLSDAVSLTAAERLASALGISVGDLRVRANSLFKSGGLLFGPFGFRNVAFVLQHWQGQDIGTAP
ncbi:MAG: hypothetical protein AB7U83_12580 [Vicinamibacterales bacterium]